MKDNNIEVRHAYCDYSQEERDFIGGLLLERHKEVEGVPLSIPLHKKFHSIYGNKNVTKQDFEQFTSDFNAGLINVDKPKEKL